MPNKDFTLLVVDGRLWRSSQDTNIWRDWGWEDENLYSRTDPTRTLLGEEQFAWLQEIIRTDSSPLICLTGLNALHTVWTGVKLDKKTGFKFADDDRVAADYAGWVKAGSDRVIELLGSREGVVTVYGDVHVGSLMTNLDHRVIECSFGPIGRSGGRSLIKGFGRKMKDVDGRPLEVAALYHHRYKNIDLEPADKFPHNWNFLVAEFDTGGFEPRVRMRLRNLRRSAPRRWRDQRGRLRHRQAPFLPPSPDQHPTLCRRSHCHHGWSSGSGRSEFHRRFAALAGSSRHRTWHQVACDRHQWRTRRCPGDRHGRVAPRS